MHRSLTVHRSSENYIFGLQDDAAEAQWFALSDVPTELAFDHKLLIRSVFEKLQSSKDAASSGAQP